MKDKVLLFLILLMVIAVGSFVWQFMLVLPKKPKANLHPIPKDVPITIEKTAPPPPTETLPLPPTPKTQNKPPTFKEHEKIKEDKPKEDKPAKEKYLLPLKKEHKKIPEITEEYRQRLEKLEEKLSHVTKINQELTAQIEHLQQEAKKNLQLLAQAQTERQKHQLLYNITHRDYTIAALKLEETEKKLLNFIAAAKEAAQQHITQAEQLLQEASKNIPPTKLIYPGQLLSQAKDEFTQQNYYSSLILAARSQAEINALNLLAQHQKTENRKNILAHAFNLLLFWSK